MANRMTYSVKVDSIFSIGEQIFNRRKGTSPVNWNRKISPGSWRIRIRKPDSLRGLDTN